MSIFATIAAVALAALLLWKIGAPCARFVGVVMVAVALASIVFGGPIAAGLPMLATGALLWLAGHVLSAYKTRVWSSRLAENIVAGTPLRYLDPVGGHEQRDARRTARAARAARAEWPARQHTSAAPIDHFAQWERELTAPTPAPRPRPDLHRRAQLPARPALRSYGTRAAKVATTIAVRKAPGARAARSAWRFLR